MTAEIALLNKMAVTLAADSAVTIGTNNGPKVYNSADKIFEATNHDPIGVMVYNSPELGGIPVENIVKMYRDRVCDRHYPRVFDFAEAFLQHVEQLEVPPVTIAGKVQSLIALKSWDLQRNLRGMLDDLLRGPEILLLNRRLTR